MIGEIKINLVNLEEFEENGKAKIALFTRDSSGSLMIIVDDFKPYFYIKSLTPTDFKSIEGFDVIKKTFDSYNVVKAERTKYDWTGESDCHFTTRYLIDKVDKIDKVKFRIHYLDIEKDIATNQTISIATYDNYLDKCVCFAWRKDLVPHQENKNYVFEKSGHKFKATIHYYNTRKAMFKDYIKFVQQTSPDIFTGWFVISYDLKEIIQELKSIGLNPGDLSQMGKAYMIGDVVSKHESNIKIYGRVLFDMLKAYSTLQPNRLPSKSLEAISQKELGEGKAKHRNFKDIWNNMDELVEYNCKDSMLVYRINEKKKIIDYFDTLRRFVGCDWGSLFAESLMWDCYTLRKMHGIMALPYNPHPAYIDRFKGATVLQPNSKGIHPNLLLTDFRRLYPSSIITFNMSPDTIYKGEGKPDPSQYYILPNGVAFRKEPRGILPTMLLELFEIRDRVKKEMKTFKYGSDEYETLYQQQFAIKVLSNALYGVMAYAKFRLATPEVASSTALMGRLMIAKNIEILKQNGYETFYADTDSSFIFSHESDPQMMVSELSKLVDLINIGIKAYVKELGSENCQIVTEAKAVYKNFMMSDLKSGEKRVAKKRYAGLRYWVEGQFLNIDADEALEMVGYEEKRSDNSQLSRDLQKQLFKLLLGGSTKSEVKSLLQKYIKGIRNNSYPLDYIGISRGVKDLDSYLVDNPHRRGCIYTNTYLHGNFGIGSKPKIIYVSSTGKYPRTDVVAFENPEDIPKDFYIDAGTMISKTIVKKVEHILDAAGFSIEEMMIETSSLEAFF